MKFPDPASLPGTTAIVLVAMALAALTPLLATLAACPDTDDADCCNLGAFACICCVHSPRVALTEVAASPGGSSGEGVDREAFFALRDALPRDILHIPRS